MENIAEAYRFLMLNYESGDKIYMFGFSRGAFTVRALAGMLYSVGLLYPGTDNLIRYAQEYWQKDHRDSDPSKPKGKGQILCEEFKHTMARSCPVHFIGVWDTVSSVGFINQFKTFPFTARNPDVSHVRHAVSIDERRSLFRQNLMFKTNPTQDIKNVWFSGVHSDVGGGYPGDESGLAKVTFKWLIREAEHNGLIVDKTAFQHELTIGAHPDSYASMHNSLMKGWWLVEAIPVRRYRLIFNNKTKKKSWKYVWNIPWGKRRDVKRDASLPEVFLHQSVMDRIKKIAEYRPINIPHDEQELKNTFQIET